MKAGNNTPGREKQLPLKSKQIIIFYYIRLMKNMIVLSVLLIGFSSNLYAQKIEKFFDYQWNPCEANMARFYAMIEHTDSGWLRHDYFLVEKKLHMKGLYNDSACKMANGHFYFFDTNGILESTGQYRDNKKDGIWFGFYSNGFYSDSTVYASGEPTGTSLQWYKNRYLSDSSVYNTDGNAVSVSWFDDGAVSSAGRLNALHQNHGKWQFFHRNGKLSATEIYDNGKLVDRKYFAEDSSPITDTTDYTNCAIFPGGIPAWTKFLEKKLYFPNNYQIVNRDKAVVVVVFTVDENGDVKDVKLQTPFHPAFDDIAVSIIKKSPKWLPAISHNRKVPYKHTQTINFTQIRN